MPGSVVPLAMFMLDNINMTQHTYDSRGEIYDICSLTGEGGVLLAKMFFLQYCVLFKKENMEDLSWITLTCTTFGFHTR